MLITHIAQNLNRAVYEKAVMVVPKGEGPAAGN